MIASSDLTRDGKRMFSLSVSSQLWKVAQSGFRFLLVNKSKYPRSRSPQNTCMSAFRFFARECRTSRSILQDDNRYHRQNENLVRAHVAIRPPRVVGSERS